MENRTNFSLNKNIEIWKSELSKNSKMTLDNINELESHLRDNINELELLGLSNEESFIIAKNRIGNVKDLTTEFGKVNTGFYFKNKLIPYLKGILLFLAFVTLTQLITIFSGFLAKTLGFSENVNFISIGTLTIVSLILMMIGYLKFKNINLDLSKLTSIPILASIILVSKILVFLCTFFIFYNTNEISELIPIMRNISYYKEIFGLFILIFSFVVFFSLKRNNKVEIAE